jgi:hypothetical protein
MFYVVGMTPPAHNPPSPLNLLVFHVLVVAVEVSAATSSRRSRRSKTRSWACMITRSTFLFAGLSRRLSRTILHILPVVETGATRRSISRMTHGTARSAIRVGTSLNTGESGLSSSLRCFSECDSVGTFWVCKSPTGPPRLGCKASMMSARRSLGRQQMNLWL